MKTTVKISMALCLVVLSVACKKNHVNKMLPSLGTWELRATKGGNIVPTTYPAGNGHLITFADTSYIYYTAGSEVTHGGFQENIDNNGNATITFKTGDFKSQMGALQGDTLKLKPFNPEIATSYYVQKK